MDTENITQSLDPIIVKTVTIEDIELRIQAKHRRRIARQYYLEFRIGDATTRLTKAVKGIGNPIVWGDKLLFHGDDRSPLVVKVFQKHHIGKDKVIATLTSTIGDIFPKLKDGVLEETLVNTASDGSDSDTTLKFSFTVESRQGASATELQAVDAVAEATGMLGLVGSIPKVVDQLTSVVDIGTTITTEVQTFETTWGVLLKRMALFNKIVTDIAAIHPYTSLAWSVISTANQLLVNQKDRDDRVIRLAGTMGDVFSFVHDAEPLKSIKAHMKTITLLLQQVTECGYFITEYTKQKNFWIRTAKYTISDIDSRISSYENRLQDLKNAFLEQVTLQTGITVVRMMNTVEHIAENIDLNDMPYAHGARHSIEKGCLPGTRVALISEICDILNNPTEDAPRVCLLTGVAGSGKSAVAHSIARLYAEQERLGSSYCFSRSDLARRNPENLFTTIARDLSDRDPQYKSALWNIVKDNRSLRTSTSLVEQVTCLIIEPIKHFHVIGPLVVVIDALDESGDPAGRRRLLQVLSTQFAENTLPMNLRFLITSREENDILFAFSSGMDIVHKRMVDILDHIVDEDIERFIYHSLHHYSELESTWPNREWCRILVHHSQQLFQWASTACNFVEGDDAAWLRPCERLQILVEAGHDESVHPLDELYGTILKRQFTRDSARRRFHDVMAIILSLKEPLSLSSLVALFGDSLKAREIVKPLGSLLGGAFDEDKPIRPLHTSFRDFLLDETRSLAFHVTILSQHSLSLGQALLACMQGMLKFNICDLSDSRLRNADVPDLTHRVNVAIPPHLSYSCLYWMTHLQHVDCTLELLNKVTLFFKNYFPYWLEAISLLSLSSPLSSILSALETCTTLQIWAKDYEIATLSSEAFRFIQSFAPVLRDSTPHLYLSAMAQTPSSSPLCALWADHLQRHVSVASGYPATWPAEVHDLKGHANFVFSVVYSPDGHHIVSGSGDKTIRVWDATTGQTVAGPFQGHTDAVLSVVYSPDGRYIVSGSRDTTIRVWDTTTGQIVVDPFQGHTKSVFFVVYSPDGRHIVSASEDTTIRVWDITTGLTIVGPLQGHTGPVESVAYSPNGKHIVSGSWDKTIRIWDAATGQTIVEPFQGHLESVTSVVYSPDGRHIVSSSWDKTIRVWDITTGQTIMNLIQGHTESVTSVNYSPDGRYIVSGSWDKTIRVWDATTGQARVGPIQGHIDPIISVAYSPNGRHIVSCSQNNIKVWDITSRQAIEGSFKGHTDSVQSVTYSPDGKYIVSGSHDKTIKIWDAGTGQIVSGLFEGLVYPVESVVYSPDGKHIASSSGDNTFRVWDVSTGQTIVGPFQGHTEPVIFVLYSPDGRYIASTSLDRTIRIWDATTGQTLVGPLQDNTYYIQSIAYSPDGCHIVSGSWENTIKVWDATTGQARVGQFQGHTSSVQSIVFSPDGKHIVSGSWDKTIRVWDIATGETIMGPLQGHTDSVQSVAYSSNGNYIVSGSLDNTLRLWNAITGQLVAGPFQGHISSVQSVGFSPDGKHMVSGSVDKTVKVWRVQDLFSFNPMHIDDGWIQSSNGTLFGWIAPWNRTAFHLPVHSLIIAPDQSYQVHFDTSLVEEPWFSCWK